AHLGAIGAAIPHGDKGSAFRRIELVGIEKVELHQLVRTEQLERVEGRAIVAGCSRSVERRTAHPALSSSAIARSSPCRRAERMLIQSARTALERKNSKATPALCESLQRSWQRSGGRSGSRRRTSP